MARDPLTLDLFRDFTPPDVVARFPEDQVHAGTLADKLSRAVRATLDAVERSRSEIAASMSAFLGDGCSKTMLDKYASQGADKTISAVRLAALVQATDDARPLNTLLEPIGLIAVPARYEWLIRREQANELRAKMEKAALAADAQWRARQ